MRPSLCYSHRFCRLLLVVVLIAGVIVALPTASSRAETPTEFHEAPMLAELVAEGKLPPVQERLPENPHVIEPFEQTGTYGGTLRMPFVHSAGWEGLWFVAGWQHIVRWSADTTSVVPNIAEAFEVNENATVYTFHLRKGLKWSDGVPFTADDVLFALNDIWLSEAIVGPIPPLLAPNGDKVKVNKVNDYTVTFTFTKPYGLFLQALAQWGGERLTHYPKHWLEKYHLSHNPNVNEIVATTKGVSTWLQLLKLYAQTDDFMGFYTQAERPTLYPWVVTQPQGSGNTIVLERNPYFWAVDSEGNQLPYIDKIVVTKYKDTESLTLAALNGELDYTIEPPLSDLPLYRRNESSSKLYLHRPQSAGANVASIHFNRTVSNPDKASIFGNKDFRIGMSHAIDRKEIIDVVYFGQGTPRQVAPMESSPLYNEKMATQYTEYDVDLANEHLAKAGLDKRDSDGFRLMPNGERLTITLTVTDEFGQNWPQTAELLVKYWKDVGVEVQVSRVDPPTRDKMVYSSPNNPIEATIFTGEGGLGITAILDPRYFVPNQGYSMYASGWSHWFAHNSPPSAFVTPPDWVKEQVALYNQVLETPNPEDQIESMRKVIDIAAEEFYVIGIASPPALVRPLGASIKNVPPNWILGWIFGGVAITSPAQWYFVE